MNKINGKTKLIGFFGSTYKSSKMYKLYNTAFEALDLNYCYVPCAVDDLEKAFSGVLHLGFRAIGVSFPYKESIIPYLDELEPEAAAIGAVNVVTHQNGKLIGGMTDGLGAVCALEEVVKIDGSTVVVLGAGGAAKAIAYELSKHHCSLKILNRTIEKEYKAVVCGKIEFENIEINAPIGRNPDNFVKMAVVSGERESLTLIRRDSEKVFGEYTYTGVTVYPKTGRTHQIRVHLTSIKHPVAGDKLYAGKSLYALSFEIFRRMMLHARKISFESPTSGELVSFESPLPKEFDLV